MADIVVDREVAATTGTVEQTADTAGYGISEKAQNGVVTLSGNVKSMAEADTGDRSRAPERREAGRQPHGRQLTRTELRRIATWYA